MTNTPTTLWRVQFVRSSIGVWDAQWFAAESDALAFFNALLAEGYDPELDDGSQGSVIDPEQIAVDLSPAGLLAFANQFAVDTGA